jgi:hypothetical protein
MPRARLVEKWYELTQIRNESTIDLPRDVPTTAEDVEALVPEGVLDRHPVMRPDARPFTLP